MPKSAPPAAGKHRNSAVDDGPTADHGKAQTQPVDASEPRSVSFAAKSGDGSGSAALSSRSVGHEGHAVVGVGPGIPGAMLLGSRAGLLGMNPFPIVGARIHPPLLRADTLSRERLNDWLDQAATGRVALVVAEAGFGKTTFLADWARHSARLTAWYRLDPDDRDWLTFSRHLVAAGRELDPEFAPDTYALLMQLGPGGPTRADIQASLVREYAEFGAAHSRGLTLIFDDFHSVDGSDEVVPLVRALVEQTAPTFSIVIASRSAPQLALSRLRARGAVSRIGGEALRFDVPETDRLFRDAYRLPIEPDVVDELVQRTEGWAALLSLVRTNADGHAKVGIPALVHSLTGAAGDMHDYLAEEVLAHLDPPLADFLVKSSILEDLNPRAASVVAGVAREQASSYLEASEVLALVTRDDSSANHRFVPLVREFLAARLVATVGEPHIRAMHLSLARSFERSDWRVSATHYLRSGDRRHASDVVCRSLEAILGAGQYRAADDLLAGDDGDLTVRGILRSRLLLQVGSTNDALREAAATVRAAEANQHPYLGLAAQNAASIAVAARSFELVPRFARVAAETSSNPATREVAAAYATLVSASADGSLPIIVRQLERMLATQSRRGQPHYAAITSLNLAQCLVWLDQPEAAIQRAHDAEQLFEQSSQGYEIVSVRLAQAQAHAHLGRWDGALKALTTALDSEHPEGEFEAALEAASLVAWFGPSAMATDILSKVDRARLPVSWALHWRVIDLWLTDQSGMARILVDLPEEPPPAVEVAAKFRWHLSVARALYVLGDRAGFASSVSRLDTVVAAQRSPVQRRLGEVIRALGQGPTSLARLLVTWPESQDPILGVFASEVVDKLDDLPDEAVTTIVRAALGSPQRWLDPIRKVVSSGSGQGLRHAGSILDEIGERSDVPLVRSLNRRTKRSGQAWGDRLVRRLAPAVFIDDLGAISLAIGQRPVHGYEVRRKVLSLMAFLACQPGGSATPDQILEALWPELQPDQGLNSVHQTIYFLRRVLDPEYAAGRSADYLHFDDDIVSLDRELVDCASWRCRRRLTQRPETQVTVEKVLDAYRGKFAGDFAYEDWASPYRETLHAAFLGLMERAVSGDIGSTELRWRLWVGQRTLAVDPEADAVEAAVIRLYRALGAPTAAAEQYAHYASMMRDQLGVEPPTLEEL